jgi:hypothetical protein
MDDYRAASVEVSGAASQLGSLSKIERRSDIVPPPNLVLQWMDEFNDPQHAHWEEYEVYTLEDLEYYFECSRYSELHKSVHGFRPRGEYPSYGDMLEEIKYLEERLERILIQEEEEQKLAIVKFEERLKTIIESGAGDRETALRWLVDSHDGDFDREYVEDHFQLPYGYLKKVA